MQSGLFENAMTDVTGKIRLESEDPRWIQLFSAKSRDRIVEGFDLAWFGNRLIDHNLSTGNLNQLIVQTRIRLHQVLIRNASPPCQLVDQCCTALHVSTLILHFIVTTLAPHSVRKHLSLSDSWPAGRDANVKSNVGLLQATNSASGESRGLHGEKDVESLITELCLAIDSPLEYEWLRDVRFFCVDMLLVLCSTQLYANHNSNSVMTGRDDSIGRFGFNSDADLFMNHLFSCADEQLRAALGNSQSTSGTFANCLAVQLVRGLVRNGAYTGSPAKHGLTTSADNAATSVAAPPHSATLQRLASRHAGHPGSDTHAAGEAAAGGSVLSSVRLRRLTVGSAAMADAVKMLLWGFFLYLPMTALQRLFRMPDSGASTSTSPSSESGRSDLGYARDMSPLTLPLSQQQPIFHTGNSSASAPPASVAVLVPGSQRLAADPLPERCLHLLLVLLHNRRAATGGRPNPFREAFGLLHDLAVRSHAEESEEAAGGHDVEDLEGGGGGRSFAAHHASSFSFSSSSSMQPLMQGQGGRSSAASSSSASMFHASRIHISLPEVIVGVCRNLPTQDHSALVLYSLLQGHPTFTESVVKTGSTTLVFSSCLKGLYSLTAKPSKRTNGSDATGFAAQTCAATTSLNQLYVLVVCVLMLVQDGAVLQDLTRDKGLLLPMDWYSERQISHATTMDATLLCLLRVMVHALFRLQDQYLVSNACAILYNLSSRLVQGMLPYTAERLVKVICQLCSRAIKYYEERTGPSEKAFLLSEALCALLQLVDTALSPERVASNVHLLYALMQESHSAEQLFAHAAVGGALRSQGVSEELPQRLVATAQHYLALLDTKVGAANGDTSNAAQTVTWLVDEMKIGRKHSVQQCSGPHGEWSTGSLQSTGSNAISKGSSSANTLSSSGASPASGDTDGRCPPPRNHGGRNRFSYQEAENAEEFFLPCIWTSVLRSSPEIPWNFLQLTLVDPVTAGFVSLQRSASPGGEDSAVAGDEGTELYSTSMASSVDLV